MPAKVGVAVRPVQGFGEVSADTPITGRWTICILAGGQSSRMGRDKSRIIVAGRTLLQHVRSVAALTGLPARTIRRDAVAGCGPLGGIFTGLRRARSGWCLFLTCDMPLVTRRLIDEITDRAEAGGRPVFIRTKKGFGFPLALPVTAAPLVERLIAEGRLSVQALAGQSRAYGMKLPRGRANELANANTLEDLVELRRRLAVKPGGTSG